uniref:BCAS3 WD40 domain-containing protein n=1 Tax=Moniliophthora roreri TaxID=221103 RepID=A0A0W0GCZ6_MONRR
MLDHRSFSDLLSNLVVVIPPSTTTTTNDSPLPTPPLSSSPRSPPYILDIPDSPRFHSCSAPEPQHEPVAFTPAPSPPPRVRSPVLAGAHSPPPRKRSPDLVRATPPPRVRSPDLVRATSPPRVRSPDLVRAPSPRVPSPPRVRSPVLARAPSPAAEPVSFATALQSTPAPAPTPFPPTSPRTSVRPKASVAASSPKTPTASQTLSIPIPPTAAGVSPPAVSKPVSFGRFTGTGVASNLAASSGSGSTMGEPVDLEGTIRPPTKRRQPTHERSVAEDENHRPTPRARQQQQQQSNDPYEYAQRRMSYGQGYYDQQQQHNHRDRRGSLPMMQHHHLQYEQHHRTRSRSGISQAMNPNSNKSSHSTIISAKWDMGMRGKKLLMVGYHPLGIQVWDCTRLDEVVEVLNLPSLSKFLGDGEGNGEEEWEFVHAGVLGEALVGVLVSPKTTLPARNASTKSSRLVVYSLSKHALVKQITIPGLASGGGRFEIGDDAVVVSTTHPPALHVLSLSTYEVLHEIPAAELALFCAPPHPRPVDDSRRNSLMSSMYSTSTAPFDAYAPFDDADAAERIELAPPQPAPVYSISGRLLAYASGGEQTSHHVIGSGTAASTSTASAILSQGRSASIAALASFSEQIANLNRSGGAGGAPGTGTDLGSAAMKMGGGLLSGMKSLGGMAYKGAVNASNGGGGGGGGGGIGAFANRFFSKSAPAAASVATSRGVDEGVVGGGGRDTSATPNLGILGRSNSGSVTVLDLDGLKDKQKQNHTPTTMVITRFIATTSQPIADIWFSQDGTSVMVAPKDGQVVHVYGIRSNPVARVQASDEVDEAGSGSPKSRSSFSMIPDAPPSHVYDLRRGRTPGVVESASWSLDQRWVAFGTRKRTVHVFAVNPYGGKSDVRSHLEGIVRNYTEMPPLSTELSPLVRLRVTTHPGPDQPKVPLAFTFLDSPCLAESTMPANLLPAISSPSLLPTTHPHQQSYGSANSNHTVFSSSSPSARSEPISPNRQPARPKNYQDVLVFDPTDGVLSLRRITVSAKAKSKDNGSSILGAGFGSTAAAGAVSISRSLPGMSAVGKLAMSVSVSPNTPLIHGRASSSGLTQAGVDSALAELSGKESTVATWNLGRRKDWGEIKKQWEEPAKHPATEGGVKGKTTTKPNGQADWLAQAELSTFSKSTRVLPRSIYLTHQFSFHALGEDYHALIRRYQFDIPGTKIEVRKGVEVSAYPTGAGTGESFVEGGGAFHRRPSSFDEPLASALAGEVDYTPPQTILPMLPNGHPGSKPRSFKNSIPIRSLGDGMTESLGRFKREINKVRSPRMVPSSDTTTASTSVPLEFDEEDEDFLLKEEGNTSPSGSGSGSEENHPPATGAGGAGTADTWVGDDAETFDHISAVGFLDEEQESMVEASKAKNLRGKKGRKKY